MNLTNLHVNLRCLLPAAIFLLLLAKSVAMAPCPATVRSPDTLAEKRHVRPIAVEE